MTDSQERNIVWLYLENLKLKREKLSQEAKDKRQYIGTPFTIEGIFRETGIGIPAILRALEYLQKEKKITIDDATVNFNGRQWPGYGYQTIDIFTFYSPNNQN